LPTPVEHLRVAEETLASGYLPESIRAKLDRDVNVRGAYFFGHIAPDVQVVSRQPRESTHFFSVPPTHPEPGFVRMLLAFPWMARPAALSAAQAAFLTGYISHLFLDEYWVREIFHPVFGQEQTWGSWHERLLLHNVLRAWLDRRDLNLLAGGVGALLCSAEPGAWLPFAADADLTRWRDLVADQFTPGAEIRTVEILAHRSRIAATDFRDLLEPRLMEERIFSRVSLESLNSFRERALARTLDLTAAYWNGCALPVSE
jgi:hypothetical protein